MQPRFQFGDLALQILNSLLKLTDDLIADGQVIEQSGGVRAHVARSSEIRRSGQEQIRAWKRRRSRKSAVSRAPHFSLTSGVNG